MKRFIVRASLMAVLVGFGLGFTAQSAPPGQSQSHAIGTLFDDGGILLAAGETKYYTVPFGCTIQGWNMTALPPGSSATVDVWKAAGAYPTASNSIIASATPAISGFTPVHSTNLTGWNVTVSQNDTVAFYLSAVGSATQASLVLQCQ